MPTTEELSQYRERIAKADNNAWVAMQRAATDQGLNLDEVVAQVFENTSLPVFAAFPEGEKWVYATRAVWAKLMNAQIAKAEPFIVQVIDKTGIRVYKDKKRNGQMRRRGSIYAVARRDAPGSQPTYCHIGLFDESVDLILEAEVGKTYRVMLGGKPDSRTLNLSANSRTHFNVPVEEKFDVPTVLKSAFPVVPLAEADKNISKPGYGDLKLIHANVLYGSTKPRKDGTNGGRYSVVDTSLSVEQIQKMRGFTVWVDPAQVKFGGGSSIWFLGRISKSNSEEYGPSMNADCMVVEVGIPIGGDEVPPEENVQTSEVKQADTAGQQVQDFSMFAGNKSAEGGGANGTEAAPPNTPAPAGTTA